MSSKAREEAHRYLTSNPCMYEIAILVVMYSIKSLTFLSVFGLILVKVEPLVFFFLGQIIC